MKISFPVLFFAVSLLLACQPDNTDPATPETSAPTAISLSASSVSVKAEGATQEITITSPARPKLEIPSEAKGWLSYTDGIFKDYKIKVTLKVAANTEYEGRSAVVTVSASGVDSKSITVSQDAKEVIPDPTLPDNDAVAMAKKLGFGWNLGNEMEAHNNGVPAEDAWTGVKCTQSTFDKIKEAGISSVRIPVTWISLIGEAPYYTLDADRLARLKTIVGYAHTAGLITIINIHHDGANSDYWLSVRQGADNNAILDEIGAVWTQLAEAFKDEGDWLIFESFNEIHDGQGESGGWGYSPEYRTEAGKKRQNDILNGWNQKFVDVVRKTGGNNETRWLGVPGYAANPDFTLNDGFVVPNDPAGKVMVAVHTYGPYKFGQTGEVNQWGHNRKVELGDPSYGEDFYKEQFNALYTKWVANNVPVYFGEFGCANRVDEKGFAAQLYFLEYFAKAMHVFGMPGFIWDNGAVGSGNEVYGIIHHGTGEYLDPARGPQILGVCLRGFTDTSKEYTLQSIYDRAPEF